MATPKCQSFVEKFPDHELAVRRLILRDRDFGAVCENHEACLAAARHWEEQGFSERAAEYRRLSSEIEEEILAYLSRSSAETRQMAAAPSRDAGTKN